MSHEHETRAADAATRPRFWTRGMIVLFAALGILLLLVVVWLCLNAAARGAVERELNKIRAKGEPATLDELAPPPVPDDQNAAVVFDLAFAELARARAEVAKDEALREWDCWSIDEIGEKRGEVEKALNIHAEALRLTRQALSRPKCRFDLDYEAGFHIDLRSVFSLRALARLLKAEGFAHAHAGRAEEAARSFLDVLRLARAFEGEPMLILKLMQVAILGIGTEALQDAARLAPPPENVAREIIAELGRYDSGEVQRQAMMGERVFAVDIVERLVDGELDVTSISGTPSGGQRILVRAFAFQFLNDAARIVKTQTEIVEAARLPPWEALPRMRAIEAPIDALPAWRAPLTKLLLPALAAAYVRFLRCQAECDATRLGLACELFRSKRGRYPARLAELAPEFIPELPPDPFTGKEFKYVLRGKGAKGDEFVVYSVGEDLVDNGGVFNLYVTGDIVWEGGSASRTGGAEGPPASD